MARILLAEDEESVRNLVSRGLSQDGHAVTATADGGEALDELVKSGGQFDLLLTDIKMPVMDGIALALSVARDYPNLPIVLMTGYASIDGAVEAVKLGASDYLTKPFAFAELLARVQALALLWLGLSVGSFVVNALYVNVVASTAENTSGDD